MAEEMSALVDAEVAQVIGHTALFYRPSARGIYEAMQATLAYEKREENPYRPRPHFATSPRFRPPVLLDASPGPGGFAPLRGGFSERPRSGSPRYVLTLETAAPQTARRLPVTRR